MNASQSSASSGARFQALLQLLRLPNVFTAVADVAMGFLVTHGSLQPAGHFSLLVASSVLLYWAGMVLNDVLDVEQDTRERPHRPIPSGRISLRAARLLGFELLICGMACGWAAAYLAGDWRPGGVATLLAVLILLYDLGAKRTLVGPVVMGGCRMFNVLLGMSLAAAPHDDSLLGWSSAHWVIALGIGIYIMGVTLLGRTEARQSRRLQLAMGSLLILAGLGLLAMLPRWAPIIYPRQQWLLLWALLTAMIGWRCLRALVDPSPPIVQAAVKHGVLSIIFLDAAVCAGLLGGGWGIVILMLAIPAMYLGRWIYST